MATRKTEKEEVKEVKTVETENIEAVDEAVEPTEETVSDEINEELIKELVNAKIAEMMASAEVKSKEIIENAEKKAAEIMEKVAEKTEGKSSLSEENEKINAELEEYTLVHVFKGDGKYAEDIYLSVNGDNCLVKRGYPIRIKKKFAVLLEQSYQQDLMAKEYMEKKEKEYELNEKEYM